MNEKTLKVLKDINKLKTVSNESVNKIIIEAFSETLFEGTTAYFKHFLNYTLNLVESKSLRSIFNEINKIIPKLYENVSVQDNFMTKNVRIPIRNRFGANSKEYKLSKQLVALDYNIKGTLLKEQKEKAKASTVNKIIIDPEEFSKVIIDNVNSDNIYNVSIGLLLASGCRPYEMYHLSDFSIEEGWIKQKKLAKKKDFIESSFVIKPVLYISPETFIEKVRTVRDQLKEEHGTLIKDGEMKKVIMNNANDAAKTIFKEATGLTQRSTRPIYAVLSYNSIGKLENRHGKTLSINEWIQETLGHDNLATSINYRKFIIKREPEETEQNDFLMKLEKEYKALKKPRSYQLETYGRLEGIPRAFVRNFFKKMKALESV